ncbi:hypothetical protein TWF694_007181 [Orbilia ellipsospora]|uniref:Yeast cell wall synthesis Kre9/Knh1-like N-terminal domain-containing protein n=1 Tax=Orbilia ellipsospora TaxID=2528407 RepID=A0AAV9XNQ1_9PEZI
MWISRSLVLLSLSLVSLVSAASKVTSPSSGDKIIVGQPTTVKWTSDSKGTISLSICFNGGTTCNQFAHDLDNTGSYSWTPDSTLQPRSDYYILLVPSDQAQYPSSGLFSIANAPTSTTSSPTSTGGTTPTGASSGTTTGSSSATSSPDNSGSSSNGAVIGGAIAAVVVVVVIAVIGFIWMRKRNQRKLAEARAANGNDDGESGEKKRDLNGAAGVAGKKKDGEKGYVNGEAFAPRGVSEAAGIPMAELPAMQQEAVEMSAIPSSPSGGTKFFAMELDSREIQRPSSAVKPDVDPASNPTSPKSPGRTATRNTSIDGTTVNTETERPKTAGSIEQIKESSQENLTPSTAPSSNPEPPRLSEEGNGGPSVRDSMPQIGSIPKLGGFDFDTAKF